MSKHKTVCPNCGIPVRDDDLSCPGCDQRLVARINMHPRRRMPERPTPVQSDRPFPVGIVAALVLLLILALLMKTRVLPSLKTTVTWNETQICQETGEQKNVIEHEKRVPRSEAGNYPDVETYVSCESPAPQMGPESQAEFYGNPGGGSGGPGGPLAPGIRQPSGRHTGFTPHDSVYEGMPTDAAVAAWGEPRLVDQSYSRDGKYQVERWIYGDPVFGIPILTRYIEIVNGKVVEFHTDDELERFYSMIVVEREMMSQQ